MNTDSENFDALLKIMALKRHETPPPGYFDRLPGKIVAQLNGRKDQRMGFFERLFSGAMVPPSMAYAAGLIFCALCVTGAYYSFKAHPPESEPETASTFENASFVSLSQQKTQPPALSSTNEETQTLPALPELQQPDSIPVLYKQP